jgi:hypothetical protein
VSKREPQFDRMISDLERAKHLWKAGDVEQSRRLLRLVGSIALADSIEPDPFAPEAM